MPLLLVAYEIHPHEESEKAVKAAADRRKAVKDWIERHDHRKLSESSYAVELPERVNVMGFADEALKMTFGKDELYLIPLAPLPAPLPPLFDRSPEAVGKWLRQRLRLPG